MQPYRYLDSVLHGKCGVIIVIDQAVPELSDIADSLSKQGPLKVVEFKAFKKDGEKVHTF